MIISCEKCATSYHLDQKLLEPFGSKVRCTRCGHIFWAEIPSFSEVQSLFESDPNPKSSLTFEEEAVAMQMQPARKIFWTLGTIVFLILIALTARFFYIRYLHPNWNLADTWSKVFFIPVDPEGNQKIILGKYKNYIKENNKIGQFIVIEGEIKNGYPDIRQKIKIRGSLKTAENKVAMSREVYAGWALSSEELETLSLEEISQLQSTQPERFSPNVRVLPGKTLPFMILFPSMPRGIVYLEVMVVGSQKAQTPSPLKPVTG